MATKHVIRTVCINPVLLILMSLGLSSNALAQSEVVTFALEEVWLVPDISHPGSTTPHQMTGVFEWTYPIGEFENGEGHFLQLQIPWYDAGLENLITTFDANSVEVSLSGNFHDLGVDVNMFLLQNLAPDQPADLDLERSAFDIQRGISYQGHFVSGRFVRIPNACPGDLNSDGVVDASDLAALLAAWGTSDVDFDGDSIAGTSDLAIMLAAWGPCD